jgi:hypothetical protein
VAVERRLGDFGGTRNGIDGDRIDAAGTEQAGGCVQKPCARTQSTRVDVRLVVDIRGVGRDVRVLSASMLLIVA